MAVEDELEIYYYEMKYGGLCRKREDIETLEDLLEERIIIRNLRRQLEDKLK